MYFRVKKWTKFGHVYLNSSWILIIASLACSTTSPSLAFRISSFLMENEEKDVGEPKSKKLCRLMYWASSLSKPLCCKTIMVSSVVPYSTYSYKSFWNLPVGRSSRHIQRALDTLKGKGYVKRIGSNKTGSWEVLK